MKTISKENILKAIRKIKSKKDKPIELEEGFEKLKKDTLGKIKDKTVSKLVEDYFNTFQRTLHEVQMELMNPRFSSKIQIEQITGSGKVILIGKYGDDGVIQGPKGEKDWHYFLIEDAEKDIKIGDEVVFDLKKIAPGHTQAVNVKKSK